MGFWKEEFDGKLVPSIKKFAKHYGVEAEAVQIMIRPRGKKDCDFFTCINRQVREQISATKAMQGPKAKLDFSGYFLLLPPAIAKILGRLSESSGIPEHMINVLVVLKNNETFLFLMDGERKVRLLPDDEVMDDAQVNADQMEFMKQNK